MSVSSYADLQSVSSSPAEVPRGLHDRVGEIQPTGILGCESDCLNQPHLLSLAASLFPSLFLGLAICLNRVVALGAIDQPGDPLLARKGGVAD